MKLVTRRALLAGGLTIPALTTLAACGGGTQPSGPGGGSAGGDAPASGLSVWALTGAKQVVYENSFAAWEEDHPETPFAAEFFANDAYKEKIRTAVGSGNAPTLIFNWSGGTLQEYAENDTIVDLTGQVDTLAERTIDSIMAAGQIDGAQWAVPNNDTQPVILYYNTQLFEEHGVTPPTTWDELMSAIETFQAAEIIPISLAGQSVWPELMYIQYLTDRIGGSEVFTRIMRGEPDAWSDPAIRSALESIRELVEVGAFGDAFGSVVADGGADAALVHTGRAAMLLQGSWVYGTFKQDAPDFISAGGLGYLAFPALEGGSGDPENITGNPANYWSLSSDAGEEVRSQAIEYLNDYNLNEEMVTDLLESGVIPAVQGLEEDIAASEDADYLSFAYEMVNRAPHFQLSWDQALAAATAQELLTKLSQIFLGQIEPDAFIESMNATIAS